MDNIILKRIISDNTHLAKFLGEKEAVTMVWKIINRFTAMIKVDMGNDLDMIMAMSQMVLGWGENEHITADYEILESCLSAAREYLGQSGRGALVSVADFSDEIFDFYKNGYDSGISIKGWPKLSQHYRIAKRELTTITGIPGHGKSEWLDQIMVNLAQEYNWKFAIFSPENYPYPVHFEKIISKITGKPFHNGPSERLTADEISDNMGFINDHFIFLSPDENDLSFDAILNLAEKAKTEHKIDGVVIDPWNQLEHKRGNNKSETEHIGESLTKASRYARRHDIALWIVAHPTKQFKDDKGNYRPPTAYDISGSAHWFNKSDNVITVFRNADNNVDINIQKIKYKIRGKTGVVNMEYNKINGIYTETMVSAGSPWAD